MARYKIQCVVLRVYEKEKSKCMREWLSGGVSPCQGEGRGFESRLALFLFIAEVLIYQDFRYFCVSYN